MIIRTRAEDVFRWKKRSDCTLENITSGLELRTHECLTNRGEKIVVTEVLPEKYWSKIPVIYVPGWASSASSQIDCILAIALTGRRVFSHSSVHGISCEMSSEQLEQYCESTLRKIAAIKYIIDQFNLEKTTLFGYSEGGFISACFSNKYPDHVLALALMSPAGFSADDSFLRLTRGFMTDILFEGKRMLTNSDQNIYRLRTALLYVVSIASSLRLSVKEVLALTKNASDRLIRAREDEIFVALCYGESDFTCSTQRTLKALGGMPGGEFSHDRIREHVDAVFCEKRFPYHGDFLMRPFDFVPLLGRIFLTIAK